MITSDTLASSGADLTDICEALAEVRDVAARITSRGDVHAAHELAAADLANLRIALDRCDAEPSLDELWAVFVFAERLSQPNQFPDLTDGDRFNFRFGARPSAAQRRRVLEPSRLPWRRARQADIDAVVADDDTGTAVLHLRLAVDRVTGAISATLGDGQRT